MRAQTIEEKRAEIAKKLAREAANQRRLNQIERFEYVNSPNVFRAHPFAIGVDSVGF